MSDILEQIVSRRRIDLEIRDLTKDAAIREEAARVRLRRDPHAFRRSIRQPGTRIIAEIKAASPSAGTIKENPDVESIAFGYAEGGAAAISVVTEPNFFRGDSGWLLAAYQAGGLPVLMKDFVVDPIQIDMGVAHGADAVLLLASLLDSGQLRDMLDKLESYGCDGLVEVHDEAELERAVMARAPIIGVNNRDLKTFEVSLETAERLAPLIPGEAITVSESGIGAREDVVRLEAAGYDAFLVGETLMRAKDRESVLRGLRGSR